jgi:hypothetical protein
MMRQKNLNVKSTIFRALFVIAGLAVLFTSRGDADHSGLSVTAKEGKEDWRRAPVGDGEDTPDSYHSSDHRPPGNDERDVLLMQYKIHPCPNGGVGSMVSAEDPRYFEMNEQRYKERNPKFICDAAGLANTPHPPCVVYSFGSFDEISFEVR